MFEKLIAFILQSKGAVIAGLFTVGATGVLVTGTVGGTPVNLTFTQATPTATATATPSSATLSPLLAGTAVNNASTTGTGNGCADAAHARNLALTTLKDAWTQARHAINELKPNKDTRGLVEQGRRAVDEIRSKAVHDIQNAADLGKLCGDDNDKDESKDSDSEDNDSEHSGTNTGTNLVVTPLTGTPTTNATVVTVDVSVLAQQYQSIVTDAVAKMNAIVTTLQNAVGTTTTNDKKHDSKDKDKKSDEKKHESENDSEDDD